MPSAAGTSTPVGLSRRELRTVDSRSRILEAAVSCLIEEGYRGATTLRIQQRAGVSRGRLLHHFPSRDELLLAAVGHLSRVRVQETTLNADAPLSGDENCAAQVTRVVTRMWQTFHEPHFAASLELWNAARTNADIAEALLPSERFLGDVINASLNRLWGERLASHPQFETLRELLMSSMRGVAMTYSFRPRDPLTDPNLDRWIAVAVRLLDVTEESAALENP